MNPLRTLIAVSLLVVLSAGCSSVPFHHQAAPTAPVPPPAPARLSAADSAAIDSASQDTLHNGHALGSPATKPGKSKPVRTVAGSDSVEHPVAPSTPVESVMTPEERQQSLSRTVADTTTAGAALRKCGTRQLLPDQEGVFDAVRSLLAQTRTALVAGELWRAESLARKARQLAGSLNCP